MNRFLFGLLLLASVGCGGAQLESASAGELPLSSARLYPMAKGHAWSYRVRSWDGAEGIVVTRVLGHEGQIFELSSGGDSAYYQRQQDGILKKGSGGWILRDPIEVGAEWTAPKGRRATISSVVKQVSTPAGDFTGCVEVKEAGGDSPLEIATVYCPEVGPVSIEAGMTLKLADRKVQERALLLGYQLGNKL